MAHVLGRSGTAVKVYHDVILYMCVLSSHLNHFKRSPFDKTGVKFTFEKWDKSIVFKFIHATGARFEETGAKNAPVMARGRLEIVPNRPRISLYRESRTFSSRNFCWVPSLFLFFSSTVVLKNIFCVGFVAFTPIPRTLYFFPKTTLIIWA